MTPPAARQPDLDAIEQSIWSAEQVGSEYLAPPGLTRQLLNRIRTLEAKLATVPALWYARQEHSGCICDPVGNGKEYCTGHCYAQEKGKQQGLEEAASVVSALLPGMTGEIAAAIRALIPGPEVFGECPECRGKGFGYVSPDENLNLRETCERCNGTGKVTR